MGKVSSSPKKAAYFCLLAPFLLGLFQSVINKVPGNTGISSNITLFVMCSILLIGFVLGVYSLFYVKKVKGVLLPATIGLIFHVLILVIAYGAYRDYLNTSKYYVVSVQLSMEEVDFEQVILGKVHHTAPVAQILDKITSSIIDSSPESTILKVEEHAEVPAEFKGFFSGETVPYTYVAVDSGNRLSGEMRFFFPTLDPQLTCEELNAFVEETRKIGGVVTCVNARL